MEQSRKHVPLTCNIRVPISPLFSSHFTKKIGKFFISKSYAINFPLSSCVKKETPVRSGALNCLHLTPSVHRWYCMPYPTDQVSPPFYQERKQDQSFPT